MILFISLMMICSWLLPTVGIFMVDGTGIKAIFAIFLVVNVFVGGSASGAKTLAKEGSLNNNQWMIWEKVNLIVKIAISIASIAMILSK